MVIFITVCNFLFGLLLISSVITYAEKHSTAFDERQAPVEQSKNEPVTEQRRLRPSDDLLRVGNEGYEYYLRIDYTFVQSSCRAMQLFNLTKNLNTIEDLSFEQIASLISANVSFDVNLLSSNPLLLKSEKIRQSGLHRTSRTLCDYLLEIYLGLAFAPSCSLRCQTEQIRRLFADPIRSPLAFNLQTENSHRPLLRLNIHRMLIFRSSKSFQKSVYIRSYYSRRFISALITDAAGSYSSVTMSLSDRSLFEIRTGLDEDRLERDPSSIYVSFRLAKTINSFLRHQSARIKLGKNSNEFLFKQDATFRLWSSANNKELVAFESTNLPQHFIGIDPETQTAIVLVRPNQVISDIHLLEKRFLFKFVEQ